MCILAIQYRTVRDAPILVVQNREEQFDRPTQPPKIQSGKPRIVCGIDRKAGGTWFGVNQHGLFVAVANRSKSSPPREPRSRGLLARELLNLSTAKEAARHAARELNTSVYAGASYICADKQYGAVVYGGDQVEIVELDPGLHIITNGSLDDPNDPRQEYIQRQLTLQKIDSLVTFLALASRAFSRKPNGSGQQGVIISRGNYGTVSSSLLALHTRIQNSIYQYAPGPPCDHPYDDCSALLRQVLSTDRERH